VRTQAAYEAYLALGARRVVVGTRAAQDPGLVRALAAAHPDTAIVAVDAEDGIVRTWGWTESSGTTATELARQFTGCLISGVLYTDIAQDGTGKGPNVAATRSLIDDTGLFVIASGGVGTLDHLRALAAARIPAAIVGRALYEGTVPLSAVCGVAF
jgi:phosphoribosylformimino-5-aminoimidazole carboxamide ribotide isomerase